MKPDYIKLSIRSVEARGRYVPHAICSFLVLWLGLAVLFSILLSAAGASAWPFILRVALRLGL
ncbi:MAG: hypothetical protein AB1942_00055 [Pseudomonadota bacterium]